MQPHGSPRELERGSRLHAMELLKQGPTPVEVARHVGVDRRSVRRRSVSVAFWWSCCGCR